MQLRRKTLVRDDRKHLSTAEAAPIFTQAQNSVCSVKNTDLYFPLPPVQECIQDILAALQINADPVIKEILSLKDRAQKLICDWLHHFCRTNLSDAVIAGLAPCHGEQLRDAFIIGGALLMTDSRDPRWHLLHVDILLAKGWASFSNFAVQFFLNPSCF